MGSVTFENVERRMRESNLQVLSLQESVDMLESIDYADLQEDLRKQLNQIAKGQWYMVLMGQSGTLAYEQMDQAYEAVREQFDAIKDGDMQEDNTSSMRQLKNLQDQIIMAAAIFTGACWMICLSNMGFPRPPLAGIPTSIRGLVRPAATSWV